MHSKETIKELKDKPILHNRDIVVPDLKHEKIIRKINKHVRLMSQKEGGSPEMYAEERQASKPLADIALGKYGEYLASYWLCGLKLPFLEPDLEIYAKEEKSWKHDLCFSSIDETLPDFTVKTCSPSTAQLTMEERKELYSWTFQNRNNGTGGTDKLLRDKNSGVIVIFVFADMENKRGKIVASSPWRKVSSLLDDPIIPKYKNIKKCIYYSDLKIESDSRSKLKKV